MKRVLYLFRRVSAVLTWSPEVTCCLATILLALPAAAAARMDYRDAAELEATLIALDAASRHAQLFIIGYSTDYKTSPNRPVHYPIYALRVSASTDERIDDNPFKNSILFEAGTHPREWLGTESCLTLAEHLASHAEEERSGIPELLRRTDVWIVPLTTVAGRILDDQHGGDPTRFATSPNSGGWRGDGDTRACEYGVNVARNYSRGWDDASADCGPDYRGFAPFCAEEAVALRNFVQNHNISMAVTLHSNTEKIWNMWGDADVAGRGITELAQLFWEFRLDDDGLELTRKSVGNGMGQFTAWLSRASDQAGQPDNGTVRGIQAVIIELPFLSENYAGAYRAAAGDDSNGFHPSGEHVRDLIRLSFLPMAEELIRQSWAPGAPTLGGRAWIDRCPSRDFGLVGAKICSERYGSGCLETYPAWESAGGVVPARDYLAVGQYELRYRVQNFSAAANSTDVDVRLTVTRPDGRPGWPEIQVGSVIQTWRGLGVQEARAGLFTLNINRDNTDYTVVLEARPTGGFASGATDSFAANDKKAFKFRSYQFE